MNKKSPLLPAGIALLVMTLGTSHESVAAPPPLDPAPSIAGFTFWGGGATKPNADVNSFATEIPVRVSGANERTGTLIVKRNNSTVLKAPFTIAGGQTKGIPLADGQGVRKACTPALYDLELVGAGFDVKQKAIVKPSCEFSSASVNPWKNGIPQRSHGHVAYNDVDVAFHAPGTSVKSSLYANAVAACTSTITFTTTVKNGLAHAVSGLRFAVSLDGLVKGSSTPIDLAAGASMPVTVQVKYEGARIADASTSDAAPASAEGAREGEAASQRSAPEALS